MSGEIKARKNSYKDNKIIEKEIYTKIECEMLEMDEVGRREDGMREHERDREKQREREGVGRWKRKNE